MAKSAVGLNRAIRGATANQVKSASKDVCPQFLLHTCCNQRTAGVDRCNMQLKGISAAPAKHVAQQQALSPLQAAVTAKGTLLGFAEVEMLSAGLEPGSGAVCCCRLRKLEHAHIRRMNLGRESGGCWQRRGPRWTRAARQAES